jgi:hypothetical protein
MPLDLQGLIRRDHDDLDLALEAMLDPRNPVEELAGLVDVFRLAMAVHVAAEHRVLREMLASEYSPARSAYAANVAREHGHHLSVAERLAHDHGTAGWCERALDLRVTMLMHWWRSDRKVRQSHDPFSQQASQALAGLYATERLRILADTAPLATARRDYSVEPATY